MMKIIFIGILFLVASCAQEMPESGDPRNRPYDIKNNELIQFVDSFVDKLKESGRYKIHSSKFNYLITEFETIEWGNENPRMIGYCYRNGDGTKRIIRINPVFWANNQDNFASKEELMYHELGHCILDRDHNDSKLIDGKTPASVMNHYHIGQNSYEKYYVDYMVELFQNQDNYFRNFIVENNLFNGGVMYASEYSFEMLSVEMAVNTRIPERHYESITTCEH